MRQLSIVAVAFSTACVGFAGCAAKFPDIPAPPSLAAMTAEAPKPPQLRPLGSGASLATAAKSEVVAVRSLPNFKEQSLGLGAIDQAAPGAASGLLSSLLGLAGLIAPGAAPSGTEKSTDNLGSILTGLTGLVPKDDPLGRVNDKIISRLLRRGVSKIIDLTSAGRGVAVTIDQERSASADSGKGSVRWAGMLDKMVFVGRVSEADYVLYGEVVGMGSGAQTLDVKLGYDPGEFEMYKAAYGAWHRAMEVRIRENTRVTTEYTQGFEKAKAAYVKDGGKMPPPSDEPAARYLAAHADFIQKAQQQTDADKRALAGASNPQALEEQARSAKTQNNVNVSSLSLVVKLIDARTNEIIWMNTISKTDETLPACVEGVLDKLVADVLASTANAP